MKKEEEGKEGKELDNHLKNSSDLDGVDESLENAEGLSDRVTTVTTVTDEADEQKETAEGLSDRVNTVTTVTELKDDGL